MYPSPLPTPGTLLFNFKWDLGGHGLEKYSVMYFMLVHSAVGGVLGVGGAGVWLLVGRYAVEERNVMDYG